MNGNIKNKFNGLFLCYLEQKHGSVCTPISAHVNFYFPGDVIMANFSGEMEVMILGPFIVNAAILWVI